MFERSPSMSKRMRPTLASKEGTLAGSSSTPSKKKSQHKSKPSTAGQDSQAVDNKAVFSAVSVPILINQKNYITDYLKKDEQFCIFRAYSSAVTAYKSGSADNSKAVDDDMQLDDDDKDADDSAFTGFGAKAVIIHLGSRNTRVGMASDTFPRTIPSCVARRINKSHDPQLSNSVEQNLQSKSSEFETSVEGLETEFKTRMKIAKRRLVPNAFEQNIAYNSKVVPEAVHDHNDPYRIEWTNVSDSPKVVVGAGALRIAQPGYKLSWPIRDGQPNEGQYNSRNELMADIQCIFEHGLSRELEIDRREWRDLSTLLVIPDMYDRSFVVELIEHVFNKLGMLKVTVLQESLAATFGAGMSTACVVDVGAQTTTVACVDEGVVIPDSR